jgi:hypothetical protein
MQTVRFMGVEVDRIRSMGGGKKNFLSGKSCLRLLIGRMHATEKELSLKYVYVVYRYPCGN